jgi:hypothetical protein
LCVCGLNLGSFQIQTFPFLFSLFPSFQLRRAEFLFPVQPSWPNQQRIPAQQPSFEPATPFSRRQTGPACRSTFYPLPASLTSDPHRTGQPRRGRACAGRDTSPRPAGPHAEGLERAHTRVESGPDGEIPLLPRATHTSAT